MATDKFAKIDEFLQEMKREFCEFGRDIRKELVEVKTSLDLCNAQFEEMKASVSSMLKKNAPLKGECAILKKEMKECQIIQSTLATKNSEIRNLRAEANVNLHKRLGEQIGKPMDLNDVEATHCLPQRNNDSNRNAIIEFIQRAKRDAVLEKSCKLHPSHAGVGFNSFVLSLSMNACVLI